MKPLIWLSVFVLLASNTAYSQQNPIANPTQSTYGQATTGTNTGLPEPIKPNGTMTGVGANPGQLLGIKPLTTAGQATPGIGRNTSGTGAMVKGYGQTSGYQGMNCNANAYPVNPLCPRNNVPAR